MAYHKLSILNNQNAIEMQLQQVIIDVSFLLSALNRITDLEHLKRRLYFSTVHKEMSATHLHAKIPFTELKRNTVSVTHALCIHYEFLKALLAMYFFIIVS